MSGVDLTGRTIRKGAADAIAKYLTENGSILPDSVRKVVDNIARSGGTPLVVAENGRAMGVIHLKDIVKGGMRERFDQMRVMGIRTVMITGDNPLTAGRARDARDGVVAQACVTLRCPALPKTVKSIFSLKNEPAIAITAP